MVVDEAGKMELVSDDFRDALLEATTSRKRVIGTIMVASYPWADEVKQIPNISVLHLTKANGTQVLQHILHWLN